MYDYTALDDSDLGALLDEEINDQNDQTFGDSNPSVGTLPLLSPAQSGW